MKLEELYQNFMELSEEDQLASVAAYRAKRALDMSRGNTPKPVKAGPIKITEEERILMKLLGIKSSDLKSLRALADEKEDKEDKDDDENIAVLFDETGAALGEEE